MAIRSPENIILDGTLLGKLRADIEDIFALSSVETPRQATQGTIVFLGDLLLHDSEAAYDIIEQRWRLHQYTPMLRRQQGQIALIAQPGILSPKRWNPWINLGLFIATVVSVLFNGASYECQCLPGTLAQWLEGIPSLLALMSILLAHEFGHYFVARYYKIAVSLPYFIPLPFSLIGTLGAFILQPPCKTKKQLFDIGVAGPLGGLILAIPLVFFGVASSQISHINRNATSVLEGNSIFYLLVKYFMHGQLLPSFDQYNDLPVWREFLLLLSGSIPPGRGEDIFINAFTFAAWFGLLITAMNLLPVGQLDGGHIIYCILGEKARWLGVILIGAMFGLAIFWWYGWFLWTLLLFLVIGPGHPPPLNDLVEIGWPRKLLGFVMLLFFILLFMPSPFQPL
jgi:Zn-dependent protease